jgi:signal transduction histidine kinase
MIVSTLRGRIAVSVFVITVAPLAVVLGARFHDGRADLRARVDGALDEAATAPAETWPAIARRRGVRLRVETGAEVEEFGRPEPRSLRDRIGDLFFGFDGPPGLDAVDPRVLAAHREADGCADLLEGRLAFCHARRTIAGRIFNAEAVSPRAIRALDDHRSGLVKLTVGIALLAALLVLWLGRSIVRPVRTLIDALAVRAADPRRAAPVPEIGDAEIVAMASAFNRLLAALADVRRADHDRAADLAHELRGPATTMRACADALSTALEVPERRAALEAALHEGARRLELVAEAYLALARAEAGLVDEIRGPIEIGALVAAVARRSPGTNTVIDPVPTTWGVADALETAIGNLVDNAQAFSKTKVEIHVSADPFGLRVDVTDDGPGIDPAVRPRLFERYATSRAGRGGHGLGLAICRAIVEAHGGTIECISSDAGTTMRIRLPIHTGSTPGS